MLDNKDKAIELGQVWNEMKSILERQDKEIKTIGEARQETKNYIDKLNERLDQLEIKFNRPVAPTTEPTDPIDEKKLEVVNVFKKYMRVGKENMSADELKVMTVADDTTGGYFCMPETIAGELIKNIVEYSPLREHVRTRSTSARSVKIRKKTGNITGGAWVGEIGSRTNLGNITAGMIEVPVHELAGYVDISNQDLADSDFDLEQELRMEFAEQFGVSEGTAFIEGTGVNQPEGVLNTGQNALGEVVNGHASELQADALIDIFYELKSSYANKSSFLLNRATLKAIRKLKDGMGNYIWTPNLGINKPPTILERPYVECPDMPDIATNAYPIVLADLKRLYMLIDRTVIETLRDPYTQAGTGTTRFYAYKRVGGQIVLTEAGKKLKISAS